MVSGSDLLHGCLLIAILTATCSCTAFRSGQHNSAVNPPKSWAQQLLARWLGPRQPDHPWAHQQLLPLAVHSSRSLRQEAAQTDSSRDSTEDEAGGEDETSTDSSDGSSRDSSSNEGSGRAHSSSSSNNSSGDGSSSDGRQSSRRGGSSRGGGRPRRRDPSKRAHWEAVPSYSSHYASDAERPNMCKVAHRRPAVKIDQAVNFTASDRNYIPYIGTSVVRDSQLMLMRLYYSIDFPVKWFVVVASQAAVAGNNAIAYEVRHMLEYPLEQVGLVVITCEHHPSVSESWNAVFQGFQDEPWGTYMARDTFWERGALAKLAPHGWQAAETGDVDVGFVTWTNMGAGEAVHNIFVMTNTSVARFGLFDENIYPALCEDFDMFRRMELMQPPLKQHTWPDVMAVHGKRTDKGYVPGAWLPDDPHVKDEKDLTHFTIQIRHGANCNYWMRKWGCPSEHGDWMSQRGDCRFTRPFNRSDVPVWYWHTSKALRARDRWLTVREVRKEPLLKQLLDSRTNEVVFDVPKHYGEWGGYFDKTMCRLSGYLGRIQGPDGRPMCL